MSVLARLKDDSTTFSLEFFPPKKSMPISSVYSAIESLKKYDPAFVSVTYGAGGSGQDRTLEIVSHIKNEVGLETIAHLTCVGANEESIDNVLYKLKDAGVLNVLALRGDIPEGMSRKDAFVAYKHATDLISHIKRSKDFYVAAAAYPEIHVESENIKDDIKYMKMKADVGADFFITQLCFDTTAIIRFFEQLGKTRCYVPVLTGIMPILNPKQIIRMSLLSACSIPAPLSKIISRYGENADDFKKAGLEYAIKQIDDLIEEGINKFHLYTMNKSDEIAEIIEHSRLT